MKQKYEWAVEVTIEYLDGHGGLSDEPQPPPEIRQTSELDARARHRVIQGSIARPERNHPKYQRVAGSRLLRRPVGEWETVEA